MIVSQEERLRAEAASCVQDIAEKSKLFNKHAEEATPRFDPDECIVGKELGVGGFSVVYEIDKLNLLGGINAAQPRLRAEVASRAVKNGQARYALKRLKNATIRKSSSDIEDVQHQFVAGVADLALEVKFLAVLNHPHIIKMRGVCSAGLCSRDAFIVVDRLFETLDERIPSWRMNQRRFSGGLGLVIDSKGRKKEKLFAQRLSVAYSLSSAFEYLHSNRIVYRDLKPDNIGFDVRDDVKLFDFGLARELHCSDDNDNSKDNDIYSMSSEVGSLRYMAPEVANGQKYNHKVDVYAFGLILWQLCHLETPYEEYTFQNFRENVFEKGIRPKISKKDLSQSLRLADLQTRSWANSMSERPEFSEIREMLRDEIFKLDTSMRESDLDFSNKTEKSIAQED